MPSANFRRFLLPLVVSFAANAAVIHVRPGGPEVPPATGVSWASAFDTVEAAAALAKSGDEIRLAGGVYTNKVVLASGVSLVGGFAGNETVEAGPQAPLSPTVLTAARQGTVINILAGALAPTRLDNLIIRHGDGSVTNAATAGGGVAAANVWLELRNCRFEENQSAGSLGSALDLVGGRLTARQVDFVRNGDLSYPWTQQQGAVRVVNAEVEFHDCFWQLNHGAVLAALSLEDCAGSVHASRFVGNYNLSMKLEDQLAVLRLAGGNVRFHGNRFIRNGSGSGTVIRCEGGATVDFANNLFSENGNGALPSTLPAALLAVETNALARIRHNTFINTWSEVAVLALNPATVIANNLLAQGRMGVFAVAGCTVVNNAFWEQQVTNVTGGAGATGTLLADPQFTGLPARGEPHVAAGSPLRDGGEAGQADGLETDLMGQGRISGGQPDIGAFEIHDLPLRPTRSVIRVSPEGDDRRDGRSWAEAMRTPQAAIEVAAREMSEVWLRSGRYAGTFRAYPGVDLYGGFAGEETELKARNWRTNRSVLDAEGQGLVLQLIGSIANKVDGLVIRRGLGFGSGAGLYAAGGVQIRNSRFEQNLVVVTNNGSSGVPKGGAAITLEGPLESVIEGNEFVGNEARFSVSPPFGSAATGGAAVLITEFSTSPSTVRMVNNLFSGNRIVVSPEVTQPAQIRGVALVVRDVSLHLLNNTFVGNEFVERSLSTFPMISGHRDAVVIERFFASADQLQTDVRNNLFAYNDGGLRPDSLPTGSLVRSNLFSASKYPELDEPWRPANVFADPRLARTASGWRLSAGSAAYDAGDASADAGGVDRFGNPRVQGLRVDIGAHESDGMTPAEPLPRVLVRPDGDDAADGQTWATALRTLTHAVDRMRGEVAEIWVRMGVYQEKLELAGGLQLLGGFAGVETDTSQRAWWRQETVLDGSNLASGPLVTLSRGIPRLSGFVLQNGKAAQGGAVFCSSSAWVDCNRFSRNEAIVPPGASTMNTRQGGAIYVARGGRPLIQNNLLISNRTDTPFPIGGSAVHVQANASALLLNNTVLNSSGPAIWLEPNAAMFSALNILGYGASSHNSPDGPVTFRQLANLSVGNSQTNLLEADVLRFDPLLVARQQGNYRLRVDSPARNWATIAEVINTLSLVPELGSEAWRVDAAYQGQSDHFGSPRVEGVSLDIGAAEALAPLEVPSVAVSITSPTNGAVVPLPASGPALLPVTVSLAPAEKELVALELFNGPNRVLSLPAGLLSGVWTNQLMGLQRLFALAILPDGQLASSPALEVTFVAPAGNRPPRIDRTVLVPAQPLRAWTAPAFRFRVSDPDGQPGLSTDVELDGVSIRSRNFDASVAMAGETLPPLPPGMHRLTVTARDVYGAATNVVVNIEVVAPEYLVLAAPTNSPDLIATEFWALNDAGDAVGTGRLNGFEVPVKLQTGKLKALATNSGSARAFSDDGVVVGHLDLPAPGPSPAPVRFFGEAWETLGEAAGLAGFINQQGTVAGELFTGSLYSAFHWQAGKLITWDFETIPVVAIKGLAPDGGLLVNLDDRNFPSGSGWLRDGVLSRFSGEDKSGFVAGGLSRNGLVVAGSKQRPGGLRQAAYLRDDTVVLYDVGESSDSMALGVNNQAVAFGFLKPASAGLVPAVFTPTGSRRMDTLVAGDVSRVPEFTLRAINNHGWLAGSAAGQAVIMVPAAAAGPPRCILRPESEDQAVIEVSSPYEMVTLTLEESEDLVLWRTVATRRGQQLLVPVDHADGSRRFFRATQTP